MNLFGYSAELIWQSDWNGDEVGYDEVLVVGLYSVKDTDVYLYIDVETCTILDIWTLED